MTLLLTTQQLRGRIERHTQLAKAHKAAGSIRERAVELKEVREQMTATLSRLEVLRREGGVVIKPPDPAASLQLANDYRTQLKQTDMESGKEHNKVRRSAEKVLGELAKLLESAVTSIEKSIPSIDETYLKEVEQIPGYADQVQTVRRERAALLSGRSLREMEPDQLSIFLKRREVVKTLADRLTPEEFPKEVREFFSAMRRGGATLEKFTDTVRQWLADRDQLKNVRISLAPTR
jgi:hypothetical protein